MNNDSVKVCIERDMPIINRFVHCGKQGCAHVLHKNSDIYFWNREEYNIVVKCVPLTKTASLPHNFMRVSTLSRFDAEPFMEIKMLTELEKMKKVCPHYICIYHWTVYDGHIYRNSHIDCRQFSTTSVVLYLEKMDMDCYEWSKKFVPDTMACKIMMFQILFALCCMHKHIGFVHGDAHVGNVLIKRHRTDKLQKIQYSVYNSIFDIPNDGSQWCLSDFGRSRCIDQNSTNNDHTWADTPRLEFINFVHSVHTHVAKTTMLKNELSLVMHFLNSTTDVDPRALFLVLFDEFIATGDSKQDSKHRHYYTLS